MWGAVPHPANPAPDHQFAITRRLRESIKAPEASFLSRSLIAGKCALKIGQSQGVAGRLRVPNSAALPAGSEVPTVAIASQSMPSRCAACESASPSPRASSCSKSLPMSEVSSPSRELLKCKRRPISGAAPRGLVRLDTAEPRHAVKEKIPVHFRGALRDAFLGRVHLSRGVPLRCRSLMLLSSFALG